MLVIALTFREPTLTFGVAPLSHRVISEQTVKLKTGKKNLALEHSLSLNSAA
jgi:hypothetical protein